MKHETAYTLKRLAWTTNALFGFLSYDRVTSFQEVRDALWFVGLLRRFTHGGINIMWGSKLYETLSVLTMLLITGLFVGLYLRKPDCIKKFVRSPFRTLRWSLRKLSTKGESHNSALDIIKGILGLIVSVYLAMFVLLALAIVCNGLSGLANILATALSPPVYNTLVFGLFFANCAVSYRLLRHDCQLQKTAA